MRNKAAIIASIISALVIFTGCTGAGPKAADPQEQSAYGNSMEPENTTSADAVSEQAEQPSEKDEPSQSKAGSTENAPVQAEQPSEKDASSQNKLSSTENVSEQAENSSLEEEQAIAGANVSKSPQDTAEFEDNGWKEAYLQVMREYEQYIRTYENWLCDLMESWVEDGIASDYNPPTSLMCLEDLDGDRVPELLFVGNSDDESLDNPEAKHDLYVFTYKDGEAKKLLQEMASIDAGGGWTFYVAREDEKLVLVHTGSDLFNDTEILWYIYDGEKIEIVKKKYLHADNGVLDSYAFRSGDTLDSMHEYSEEEYVRESEQLTQRFDKLLIRNLVLDIPLYDYVYQNEDSAMTYAELRAFLQGDDAGEDERQMRAIPRPQGQHAVLFVQNGEMLGTQVPERELARVLRGEIGLLEREVDVKRHRLIAGRSAYLEADASRWSGRYPVLPVKVLKRHGKLLPNNECAAA